MRAEDLYPKLPTTINLIGCTKSTKDFTLQTPGQQLFNDLGSLGSIYFNGGLQQIKRAPKVKEAAGQPPSLRPFKQNVTCFCSAKSLVKQ